MKYVGSKAKHVSGILPLILVNRQPDQWYVEPFVGGANVIMHVPGPHRLGADANPYLIALLQALQDGWVPPQNISEVEYKAIRDNPNNYDPWLVAFVGFCCSFGAKWFGGYARTSRGNKGKIRNYAAESYRHLLKQMPKLAGIEFICSSYDELKIPDYSLIYCDPPYFKATGYGSKFDSAAFWLWCDKQVSNGHSVFVSEYTAPPWWRCIWEKEVVSSLDFDTGSKTAIERLFTK